MTRQTHGKPGADQAVASTKPYLLRAIYQWAVDHNLTPQVLVDAAADEVAVPKDCITEGRIVLNIHPQSVAGLEMGNRHLLFSARFAGRSFDVCIPVEAVLAIYCRENGQGIVFQPEAGQASRADDKTSGEKARKPAKSATPAPRLTLVK